MPRMLNDNIPIQEREARQPSVYPTIRAGEIKVKHEAPRGRQDTYIQVSDLELKIKVLAESIAKEFLPLNFEGNSTIKEVEPESLSDMAYIYVDNKGKPVKIFAPAVLKKKISWNDLTEDTKARIQQKLTAGAHIHIDDHNVISADIGVETINGKTGAINLTAGDLNAYNKEEVYSKEETQGLLDSLTVTVDGGTYYE